MRKKRLEAYALYESLPMPHTTGDDVWRRTVDMRTQDYWRRTRRYLRGFDLEKYHLNAPTNGKPSTDGLDDNDEETAGMLVQVDGQLQHVATTETLQRKGVYFADLHTALQEQPELLRTYFMSKAVTLETALKSGNIAQYNKFDALHGAFWQGGYLLHIPKGVSVEVPLRVYIKMSEAEQADLSHTLIIAEEGSEVVILEDNSSTNPDAGGLHSGAVEIFSGTECECDLRAGPALESPGLELRLAPRYSCQRRSRLLGNCHFCGRLSKINQAVVLDGAGCSAQMLGLAFTDARQLLDVSTAQEHISPHTSSDLLYRAVLKDRSQTAWGGNIYVYPSANHTDAYQKNDNLLLSELGACGYATRIGNSSTRGALYTWSNRWKD